MRNFGFYIGQRIVCTDRRNTHFQLIRRGKVRRAKLYYLKGLTGKRARITEKLTYNTKVAAPVVAKAE